MKENNAYILGTDTQELHRLGVQHQVWASEAQQGWNLAKFKTGDTLLDLGCGPGFCAQELAYIVGAKGKVIGIDLSEAYIEHLNKIASLHQLPIEGYVSDFNQMNLAPNSLDGMYCRWALAWLPNPQEILQKVYDALKPGGKMVIHEYYDWTTHQTQPHKPKLYKAIQAAMQSFKDSQGEINIGRELPSLFQELGMKVTHIRPMIKMATVDELAWQWPKTFYQSYFPRLVDAGYLTPEEVSEARLEMTELENTPGATLCCPLMVEVIAEK
jgi:ubiquinone/menaquinone biosynthesis C-methylase UbiE